MLNEVRRLGVVTTAALGLAIAASADPARPGSASAPIPPPTALLASVPLGFEKNSGQTNERVRFLARGPGYTIFLTPTESVFTLRASKPRRASLDSVLRMSLVGANPTPAIAADDPLPGVSHYIIGREASRWRTNVARFAKVHYTGVYPGIDLVYYGNQQSLEYDFVVSPGADPGRIRLQISGAQRLDIDAGGSLVMETPSGELRQKRPIAYQIVDGERQPVSARFRREKARAGDSVVAFEL